MTLTTIWKGQLKPLLSWLPCFSKADYLKMASWPDWLLDNHHLFKEFCHTTSTRTNFCTLRGQEKEVYDLRGKEVRYQYLSIKL